MQHAPTLSVIANVHLSSIPQVVREPLFSIEIINSVYAGNYKKMQYDVLLIAAFV